MCGITGVVGYEGENAAHSLDAMLDLINHRGPDDRSTWFVDGCGLGHVRLSIIDLSAAARQPMVCNQTGNVIVYNGEVYNYRELRELLQSKGYIFQTRSDTEVILAAYAVWGRKCVHRFIGMFAFAVYDTEKQALWMVRDRFGIKPLYYAVQRGKLVFASEIKALIFGAEIENIVNLSTVKDFCRSRVVDASDETFFFGIYQLRPGHEMWVDISGDLKLLGQQQYYSLDDVSSRVTVPSSEKGIVDEIQSLLSDSVRLRLRSDVPFAAMLSGGLDSSCVGRLACDHLVEPLHTFSAMIDPPTPESQLITIAEEQLGSIPHHIKQTSTNFFDELLMLLYHQDEPFADGSMYAHFGLMRMIKCDGRSVVLSGQGGDEVFCGYQNYLWAYLAESIRSCHIIDAMRLAGLVSRRNKFPRYALLKNSLRFCIPEKGRSWLINNAPKKEDSILEKEAARAVVKRGNEVKNQSVFFGEYLAGLDYRTLPAFLHYEDRNSMAFGVEARVPLLDHRLVEMMACLAEKQTEKIFYGGRTKSLLRQCMEGQMDNQLVNQKGKYGFPAPLRAWLFEGEKKVRDWLEDLVPSVPFLHYQNVMKAYEVFVQTNGQKRLNTMWRALILTVWYHLFITRNLSASPPSHGSDER